MNEHDQKVWSILDHLVMDASLIGAMSTRGLSTLEEHVETRKNLVSQALAAIKAEYGVQP